MSKLIVAFRMLGLHTRLGQMALMAIAVLLVLTSSVLIQRAQRRQRAVVRPRFLDKQTLVELSKKQDVLVISDTDLRQMPTKCAHMGFEPQWYADDQGRVCEHRHVDPKSHCCVPSYSKRFTCSECQALEYSGHCCEEFTHCISCCVYHDRYREHRKHAFQRCVWECRTSSESLDSHQHYKRPSDHHCYDLHRRKELLEDFEAVVDQ